MAKYDDIITQIAEQDKNKKKLQIEFDLPAPAVQPSPVTRLLNSNNDLKINEKTSTEDVLQEKTEISELVQTDRDEIAASPETITEKEKPPTPSSESETSQKDKRLQLAHQTQTKMGNQGQIYIVTSTRSNIGKSFYAIYLAKKISAAHQTLLIDFGKNSQLNLGEFFVSATKEINDRYFEFLEKLSYSEASISEFRKIDRNLYIATNSIETNMDYLQGIDVQKVGANIYRLSEAYKIVIDINIKNKELLNELISLPNTRKILVLQDDLYTIQKTLEDFNLKNTRHNINWTVLVNKANSEISDVRADLIRQKVDIGSIEYMQEFSKEEIIKHYGKILNLFNQEG